MPDKLKIEIEANAPVVAEEELILRVTHNDATAFESLVDSYRKSALGLSQRFLHCLMRKINY